MARLRWYKSKVNSGDIISFTYKGARRNVIVMECPNDVGRAGAFITKGGQRRKFLHGIQIPLENKYDALVERVIKKMGGTRLIIEASGEEYHSINFGSELNDLMNARAAYKKIKTDIDELGLYKTYHWNKIHSVSLTNSVANLEKLINPRYKEDKE